MTVLDGTRLIGPLRSFALARLWRWTCLPTVPVNDDSVSMRLTVPMMPFGRVTCDVVHPVFMAKALYQGNVKLT